MNPGARLDPLRITHQHRDPDGLLVCPALIAEVVIAPEIAVVAGENDKRIVELPGLFERLQNTPHTLVDGRQAAQLIFDQLIADRKSTRLNSSHMSISYAVFCLKK